MSALAHFLAERINPLFVALLLAAPFLPPRQARRDALRFWLAAAAGIGLAVLLAEAGKEHVVWPGHPSFPSGHETFGLACATSLVWRDRRWLPVVLPLSLALAWALVAAHYHDTRDVVGALLTGPPPALLCQWLASRLSK